MVRKARRRALPPPRATSSTGNVGRQNRRRVRRRASVLHARVRLARPSREPPSILRHRGGSVGWTPARRRSDSGAPISAPTTRRSRRELVPAEIRPRKSSTRAFRSSLRAPGEGNESSRITQRAFFAARCFSLTAAYRFPTSRPRVTAALPSSPTTSLRYEILEFSCRTLLSRFCFSFVHAADALLFGLFGCFVDSLGVLIASPLGDLDFFNPVVPWIFIVLLLSCVLYRVIFITFLIVSFILYFLLYNFNCVFIVQF